MGIRVLNKHLDDKSWRDDFKKLNPGQFICRKGLIDNLEKGWGLENWLPDDFNMI